MQPHNPHSFSPHRSNSPYLPPIREILDEARGMPYPPVTGRDANERVVERARTSTERREYQRPDNHAVAAQHVRVGEHAQFPAPTPRSVRPRSHADVAPPFVDPGCANVRPAGGNPYLAPPVGPHAYNWGAMGPPADERLVRDLAHGRFAPAPHTPVPHAAIARAPVPAAHAPAPHAPYPYTPAPPHAPAHHAPAANMFVPARDAHTFTPAPNPHAFAPAPTPHAPQAPLEALQAGPVGLSREVAAQQPLPAVRGRKKATKQPANAAEGTKQSGVRRTWPFDARELFQIAQAALETSVVSAPQGAKGKTQDAFTELVNGQGIVGSKGTFLQHLDDLIEYHADPDRFPAIKATIAGSGYEGCFGAPLDSLSKTKKECANKTDEEKAKIHQKQLEDKRGGNAIRLNSLMNRRTKASINPDSHFFHDDNHDADEPRARSHSPPPVDDAPVPATTPTPAAPRDPIAVTPDPRTRLSPVPAGAAAGTSNAGRPPTPSTPTKTKDSGTPKSSPRRRQGKSSKGPKSPSKSKKRPAEPTTPDAGERRTKRRRKDLSDPPAWVLEDRERREAQHDEAMNEARRSNQNAERNNDLFERSLQDTRNFQNDFLTLLAGRLNQPRRQIA